MKKVTVVAVLAFAALSCQGQEEITVNVTVKDGQGKPIPSVKVTASSPRLQNPDNPVMGIIYDEVVRVTDSQGKASIAGKPFAEVYVSVAKQGYYKHLYEFKNGYFDKRKDKWVFQPKHDVTLVLREKVNPIPMYVWDTREMACPASTNEWFGYDMLLGEYMPPHGNGKTEDVRFFAELVIRDLDYLRRVTVRFVGEHNGVVGIDDKNICDQSNLKLPYNAPQHGYQQQEFVVKRFRIPPEDVLFCETSTGTTNCFFRIRSKADENGNFIEGLYGKTVGLPDFQNDRRLQHMSEFTFCYYVNPTPNDLNVEFDPKRNLMKKPKDRMIPFAP